MKLVSDHEYTAAELAEFILEHYRQAAGWGKLEEWVNWNIEQGFCLLVGDIETERLTGLALVRPVMNPQDAKCSLDFDPEGDTYFVDLCIALPPVRQTLQGLGFALLKRFGMRDKIAFQRHGLGPVIVTDAHEHRRKLLRTLTNGRI